MAGLCFAFSTFIMSALGKTDSASGIRAMQAINQVIQRRPSEILVSSCVHAVQQGNSVSCEGRNSMRSRFSPLWRVAAHELC